MLQSISYLVNKTNFKVVNPEIPVTKSRPPGKADAEGVFQGSVCPISLSGAWNLILYGAGTENQKELVNDLVRKAKQIEYIIASLPGSDPEEEQVRFKLSDPLIGCSTNRLQVGRVKDLEEQMQVANREYAQALDRAR
jgi:mediator of RNA polymerase II transcription subunit 21